MQASTCQKSVCDFLATLYKWWANYFALVTYLASMNDSLLTKNQLGDELNLLTLGYVTRNMEKVLILSEENTKMSPSQWIACQLHVSQTRLAVSDWLIENSRPMKQRSSLDRMTTALFQCSWDKTVNNAGFQAKSLSDRTRKESDIESDPWHTIRFTQQGWEIFASAPYLKAVLNIFLAYQGALHRLQTVSIQTALSHIHPTIRHKLRNSSLGQQPFLDHHNRSICQDTI